MKSSGTMITKLFCVAFVIVTASAWREQVELEDAKAYAVYPETEEHYSLLKEFHLKSGGIDFVQHPQGRGGEGRVVVSKETQTTFESLLRSSGIPFEVYMKDVKATAEEEIRANEAARLLTMRDSREQFGFTAYHSHETINAHLDTLETAYPGRVKVIDAGESFEGRKIKQVLISTTGGTDESKPVIIAEGGIHAREWISPSQAMYMIHKLLDVDTEDVDPIINNIDWVIIPLLNPDGYEYTQTAENRMWKKTRSTSTSSICPGVDGNRNFGFQWMYSGSSSNPCSDTYAGPKEFSESESRVLRDTIMKYKGRAKAYLAIHNFGSWILYPYGYNGRPTPDDTIIRSVAESMVKAINDNIAASGSKSKQYHSSNAGIHLASGATDDWAYEVGKIKLSYTLELEGGSPIGFDLPAENIQGVVEETWEGIVVLAKHIIMEENRP